MLGATQFEADETNASFMQGKAKEAAMLGKLTSQQTTGQPPSKNSLYIETSPNKSRSIVDTQFFNTPTPMRAAKQQVLRRQLVREELNEGLLQQN